MIILLGAVVGLVVGVLAGLLSHMRGAECTIPWSKCPATHYLVAMFGTFGAIAGVVVTVLSK